MTQFKRQKRGRFPADAPIWVLQISLFLCVLLWLFIMMAPFGRHDAALERNYSASGRHQPTKDDESKPAAPLRGVSGVQDLGRSEDLQNSVVTGSETDDQFEDSEEDEDESFSEEGEEEEGADVADEGGMGDEEGQEEDAVSDDEEDEGQAEDVEEEEEEELDMNGDEVEEDGEDGESEIGEGTDDGVDDEEEVEAAARRLTASDEAEAENIEADNGPDATSNNGEDELVSKRFVVELAGLMTQEGDEPPNDDSNVAKLIVETRPAWAPIGVAHFHKLIDHGFYNQCRFFRVVPNFIVQFGIAADPKIGEQWANNVLTDDPVVHSNERGTITYATAGPNTRTTQLFINTNPVGNGFLDEQGFAPIAQVVEGMEFVDRINQEYGEAPNQGEIEAFGNEYLNANFPNLSYIVTIYEEVAATSSIPLDKEGGN